MPRGQLAKLPESDGRRAERRIVNLAASLRERGATIVDAEVQNLSIHGFMATSDLQLAVGNQVWLKLPGLEAQPSSVAWVDGDQAGFEFLSPLHQGVIDELTVTSRTAPPKGHFGPRLAWDSRRPR